MNADFKHKEITDQIIKAFYKVYNRLGYGFQEKVYANALAIELCKNGVDVIREEPINVYYDDIIVGEYYADLLVANSVIVETKAAKSICDEHEAQLLNYLKATVYEVGLLLNFGPKAQLKRKAYDNDHKGKLFWISKV
jgi:GxxExxY protein